MCVAGTCVGIYMRKEKKKVTAHTAVLRRLETHSIPGTVELRCNELFSGLVLLYPAAKSDALGIHFAAVELETAMHE